MKTSGVLGRHCTSIASSLIALFCVALPASGGGPTIGEKALQLTVPRAVCGPGDHPETALQGQVPAALRASGFKGFNCNLQLIGQSRGDGANWQTTQFQNGKGATGVSNGKGNGNKDGPMCGYHGTAFTTA